MTLFLHSIIGLRLPTKMADVSKQRPVVVFTHDTFGFGRTSGCPSFLANAGLSQQIERGVVTWGYASISANKVWNEHDCAGLFLSNPTADVE